MVTANYTTLLVGWGIIWLLQPVSDQVETDPVRWALPYIISMWVVAFILTVLIEWAFVAWAAEIKVNAKSLLLSLKVQTISYAVLIPLAAIAGPTSAAWTLKPADLSELQTVEGWLYYGDAGSKMLRRVRLDGSEDSATGVQLPDEVGSYARINVEPDQKGTTARVTYRRAPDDAILIEDAGAANQAAPAEEWDSETGLARGLDGFYNSANIRSFAGETDVKVTGVWAFDGMHAHGRHIALETPFIAARFRHAVVLPDGKIIVRYGKTIYLIDPETWEAAKLAEGFGGDVLLDPEEAAMLPPRQA